jgi:hypothetical protein
MIMPVGHDGVATECAHASTDLFLPTVDQILPTELSGDLGGFNSQLQRLETKDEEEDEEKAHTMKKLGFATVVAGGLTAAVLGLAAPAGAAPTGPGNAQDTINQLQADGYNVIVNRVGSTPLEQATVVAVRPGQTYSRTDSGTPGDSFGTTITGKTVYVDVG